ncbi:cytadherence high molecular weight protein 3-like [Colossoma macropomum]|uniref:cytadherence high molecular weight protein 3-like n=1 Tax=Colossoma macropomum TaxID=42526 RepID=UPI001864304D|nr:cytadherence high molecular weight protein 3-like [Colossoma macropomum]
MENTSSPSYAPQQCGYPPPPPYSPPTFQSPNYTQQVAAGVVQQNLAVQPTPQPAVIQQPAQPAVIQASNAAMMFEAGVSSPVIQSAAQPPVMLQQQVVMQPGGLPAVAQPLGAIQPMVQPRMIYQTPAANTVVYRQLF